MSKIEKAISWMEETANDDRHGYCQTHRWGEDGDYDCSAAVITAWQQAGVPVKAQGATYTGNILNVFRKCGFVDVTSKVNKLNCNGMQRGDVLLNSGNHVAMYCGGSRLVEASINEKGTITGGKPGDQTGKEFLVRSYYNYPWEYVLRYKETESNVEVKTESPVVFSYSVRLESGEIVHATEGYAGIVGQKITDIAISCNAGQIQYQVHVLGKSPDEWLPVVTGCNWNDDENGYAGDGKPIDAVRVVYFTPADIVDKYGYQKAQYQVSPVNQNYYDWQYDDEVDAGQDGYAGEYGKPIDRIRLI